MLEVRLLGAFEVKHKKNAILVSSRPAQSLFAYLILNAGTAHRREKLAGMLWPDSLEETARDNLRHALWRIRKALPSQPTTQYLLADDLTISFNRSAEYWLDAAELENVGENASADELMPVLSAYQGELLPGFYDEWAVLEREHLYSVFEHQMARLMSLLQDEKRWLDVLEWGENWIKLGQKPEPAYRALMSAHAAKGDMSKVAVTYERCVKSLGELDIQPSEATRALYERLRAGKETLGTGLDTSLREWRKAARKTNLPHPITSFIGRAKEVEDVIQLIRHNRLVTLIGPGGVGKTRLAIQASSQIVNEYADGVWWVELAPLIDEALVPQAAAQVLGVRESPGEAAIELVKDFLREKRTLLVLDNCEHLINACAQLSQDLLIQCADLKVLTTSREALDILGEREYQVQPLSLPAPDLQTSAESMLQYESTRLFSERARAKSGPALSPQYAQAVLQICLRLDGIPLALELAAARTGSLSVEEIAERLNDSFDLLTRGNRTALPRQQTLQATIDWSYKLLSDAERLLSRRLSVFAAGWRAEAAQTICSDKDFSPAEVANTLMRLLEKSIVEVKHEKGTSRYRFLDTIREYMRDKLISSGEAAELTARHLDYFLKLAEQAEPNLLGTELLRWLDDLEAEQGNLRAALGRAKDSGDLESGLRLAVAIYRFWRYRGRLGEGMSWLESLEQHPQAAPYELARAKAAASAGYLWFWAGDQKMARMHFERSVGRLRELGDKATLVWALLGLGMSEGFAREPGEARPHLEETLSLAEEAGNEWIIAETLHMLGHVAQSEGDWPQAHVLFAESVIRFSETGDRWNISYPRSDLGREARAEGDLARARAYFELNLAAFLEVDDKQGIPMAFGDLGYVLLASGNWQMACTYFIKELTMLRQTGNQFWLPECLEGLGGGNVWEGRPRRGAMLLGASEAIRERLSLPLADHRRQDYQDILSRLRVQLDEAALAAAWAEGRSMTLEQVVASALEEA